MPLKHVDIVHDVDVPSHQFLVTDNEGQFWIVSDARSTFGLFGPPVDETMVFEANAHGEVTDWIEVGVAYPAGSHEVALNYAGLTLE